MAKAIFDLTCTECGKTFTITKYGLKNSAAAESYKQWAAEHLSICPDCVAKARHAKVEAQRAQDAADGLPALTGGTQKQLDWAVSLRQKFINRCHEIFDEEDEIAVLNAKPGEKLDIDEEYADQIRAFYYIIAEKTDSRWWINNRDVIFIDLVSTLLEYAREARNAALAAERAAMLKEQPEAAAAAEEAAVKPTDFNGKDAVEIIADEKVVTAAYPRDDDFIAAAKEAGLIWERRERRWEHKIRVTSGRWQDRAAEFGNALLRRGFAIIMWDDESRRMAIDGSFAHRTERWITADLDGELFTARWERGNDSLYHELRGLPGARYINKAISIPASQWRAMMDVAGSWGFQLSDGAKALIKKRQELEAAAIIAEPMSPAPKPELVNGGLAKIMDEGSDILPDLEDDPYDD